MTDRTTDEQIKAIEDGLIENQDSMYAHQALDALEAERKRADGATEDAEKWMDAAQSLADDLDEARRERDRWRDSFCRRVHYLNIDTEARDAFNAKAIADAREKQRLQDALEVERARADALQKQLEAARKHSEPYSFPDSLDPYEVGYARGYNMARDRIRVAIDADGQDAQA